MDTNLDLYSTVFRHALFPAWERVRGRQTVERLRYLERTQWRSADELSALQVGGLRRLLVHARDHVPTYRARMADAGLDPHRLRDSSELQGLPLLTRADVQQHRDGLMAQDAGPGGMLTKSTSGTTGNPVRFYYNYDSEVWRQAVKLRAYGWAGHQPGMRTLHYWGPPAAQPDRKKALKIAAERKLRREIYLDCALQSEGALRQAVETVRRFRPQVLIGFTQATVELGRYILRHGLRDWEPMQVLCGAERLFPEDRPVLEQAFGQPGSVYETYGCREFMLIGSECDAHQGLHLSMENLVVEVVDEAGRQVEPGTLGQVAITDLHNYGMPLIRYVTGDLAIATASSVGCSCGRSLPRLSSLEGRQQDLLRGADGRGIPGLIVNAIMANLGDQIRQFQAVQKKDGSVNLNVVPGPSYSESVLSGLRDRLHPYFGDLPLSIQLVNEIPLTPAGKRRYVIVER